MKPDIAIVGPGRVGQSIGRLLRSAGYPVSAVVGKNLEATRSAATFIGAELMATTSLERCSVSSVIFFTVPDDSLTVVVEELCRVKVRPGTLLVHCSGLHTTAVFSPLHPELHQLQTLALHPLQTFASPAAGCEALPGSYCSLQGEAHALERGHKIVADLACRSFVVCAEDKVRYHAAACMASNYVTTLIDAACELCSGMSAPSVHHLAGSQFHSSPEVFPAAFAPLIQTAVRNTLKVGAQYALTGPVARADVGTVAAHLEEIRNVCPEILPVYRALAHHTVTLALKGGRIDEAVAKTLRSVLE
ncbi:MAG: DUF2520 domain-containing protein [Desulfuromonadaceae bacterium]|nr:DUF2520 domain-containing protein [Desulfuromonadaceae bacterium]